MKPFSHISYDDGRPVWYVDDKPYLALGGELHNSSASSVEYMQTHVWPALRDRHMNTLIATVSWESLEPEEGRFDFTLVEDLLRSAEREGLRLILIWFGLWKNSESHYVPAWVKRDQARFRPVVHPNAARIREAWSEAYPYIVSPLCQAAVEADARAYAALMAYLRDHDTTQRVIAMQVENEIGVLGSPRDFSEHANEAFDAPLPAPLAQAQNRQGTWRDAYGNDAEETFMAWHYARAVEHIMQAGLAEYRLPMFVNAWLRQHPDRPGAYPSGGPMIHNQDIWQLACPSAALLAPDIYVPEFEDVIAQYSKPDNLLLIPETRINVSSAASVFLAVAEYNALGFFPFGIEDIAYDQTASIPKDLAAALNIPMNAFNPTGTGTYLPQSYAVLTNLQHLIFEHRFQGTMRGFYQNASQSGTLLSFEGYDLRIHYEASAPGEPPAGGLVIQLGPDQFLVAGVNFHTQIFPAKHEPLYATWLRVEEGRFVDQAWQPRRILNGDERHVRFGSEAGILMCEAFKYPTT